MATRSSKYWDKRFSTLENSLHNEGMSCYADIEQQYRRAEHEIEVKMRSWYQRFADNNEISLTDAKQWLKGNDLAEFKWTVQDYIKAGEENALDGRWMKELENASAKYHISKLESLELELQQSLEIMYGNQLDSLDAAMRKVYTDGYYHTAFEIQKGWGVGWDFAQLDERKINRVIHKPWASDGKDFSERIWSNRGKLVNELNQTLVQNIIRGEDPQKAINKIAEKMEVSKRNAGRLVMTEEAYFASVSQADCFRELDVEQYQIIVTFDRETCDTCGAMDGRVFKMSEREVGATAPPFHPNCRCTTIPYFDEWYGLDRERAARDENGQTYQVPADMTYEQWRNKSFANDETDLQKIDDSAKIDLNSTKLTDEEIDSRIADLKDQEKELSKWGDYDDIVKDFGSIEDYFGEGSERDAFMELQNEIEQLQSQRSVPQVQINGKLPGKTMSVEDALKANPNFMSGRSYQVNCQRCVQTYEMRRRGYDVEAKPRPTPRKNTILWGNECFVNSDGKTPAFTRQLTESQIKSTLNDAPDNSRHIIYIKWKNSRTAHVFIAEKENGTIKYVDPQTNSNNVENYFSLGKEGMYGILRVDDKEITQNQALLDATMK